MLTTMVLDLLKTMYIAKILYKIDISNLYFTGYELISPKVPYQSLLNSNKMLGFIYIVYI